MWEQGFPSAQPDMCTRNKHEGKLAINERPYPEKQSMIYYHATKTSWGT